MKLIWAYAHNNIVYYSYNDNGELQNLNLKFDVQPSS